MSRPSFNGHALSWVMPKPIFCRDRSGVAPSLLAQDLCVIVDSHSMLSSPRRRICSPSTSDVPPPEGSGHGVCLVRNPTVIVLGGYETGLGVARALGRHGIGVHVLDHQQRHAAKSRFATFSICPNPDDEPDRFAEALVEIAQREQEQPVLMITADEFLLPVAHRRDTLARYVRLNMSDTGLLESIADKYRQGCLAADCGVPTPVTEKVCGLEDVERVVDTVPVPAFVKGRRATEWRRVFGGVVKGVVTETKAELRAALLKMIPRGVALVVQEIVPGDATQHFKVSAYTSVSGDVRAAVVLRKLRQHPHGFGFGCVVETVEHPVLLALGADFLRKMGYRGVGSGEYKFDSRDGRFKLIEMNTRYWQQIALAERCGVNFPLLEYNDLRGVANEPITAYRTGVKWVNIHSDLETFRDLRRVGQLTLSQWLTSLTGEKCWSDFSLDDPRPGLWAMAQQVRRVRARLRRMITAS